MNYEYTGKATAPDLTGIQDAVAASSMADKGIDSCTWHEDDEKLIVRFTGTLSGGDKTSLDTIVTDNS